mmetsp:Transcript_105707/g.295987  ORF Transcript_105707/g.295987 Transcript_105707/m.295987 type:complete len:197 (+) Transcript_105707:71-661(+)
MAEAEAPAGTSKSGYTYWKRDIGDAHVLPDSTPKKLDDDDAVQRLKEDPPRVSSVGSSWNAAGTWEEKDMSVAARAELERILSDESLALLEGANTKVVACKATVTGDSQAYNIRGRPRLGFEFKVKCSWKGTFEGEEVSGEFQIPEFDSSDLDGFEIRPSGKSSDASGKAAEALRKGARPAMKRAAETLSANMLRA